MDKPTYNILLMDRFDIFFVIYAVFDSEIVGCIGCIVYRNAMELQDINIVAINECVAIFYQVDF